MGNPDRNPGVRPEAPKFGARSAEKGLIVEKPVVPSPTATLEVPTKTIPVEVARPGVRPEAPRPTPTPTVPGPRR